MPLQTKIAQKLQSMTMYTQPTQQVRVGVSSIQDLIYITSYREVPATYLPLQMRTEKFPSPRPVSQEERQWLYFSVQAALQNVKDPFARMELLQACIFEVHRHLINADKIPSNNQYNQFTDLVNVTLLLSTLAGDLCSQITSDNLQQYEKKLENSQHENKIYLLNTKIRQLESDCAMQVKKTEEQVWKANQAEYNLCEMQKQRDLKNTINARLNKKIGELQERIVTQEAEIAELRAQYAAVQQLLKGSLEASTDKRRAQQTNVKAPELTNKVLTNTGGMFGLEAVPALPTSVRDIAYEFSAFEQNFVCKDLSGMAQAGQNQFLDSHFQYMELQQTVTKPTQDKVNLISILDAEIDLIPPTQKATMRGSSAPVGYSRVEQAETMLADGVGFDAIEHALDRHERDNVIATAFAGADVLDYDSVYFNAVTRELSARKSALVPQGMSLDNVVYASQKLVEAMGDVIHDDAYALEQCVLAKAPVADGFAYLLNYKSASNLSGMRGLYAHAQSSDDLRAGIRGQTSSSSLTGRQDGFSSRLSGDKRDEQRFQPLRLTIQPHRAALDRFLNPKLSSTFEIQQTELAMQFYGPYRQPKCVQKTASCVKAILGASPTHGGIVGIFDADKVENNIKMLRTALAGACGEYQKSMFGADFCSSQRNPFADVQTVNEDWDVCQAELYGAAGEGAPGQQKEPAGYDSARASEQRPSGHSAGGQHGEFSAFFTDYIRHKKDPPHICNLIAARIKQMGSKQSVFNVTGIKIKPAVFLSRDSKDLLISRLIAAFSGQEFEKKINETVLKPFALQYKQFQVVAGLKGQAQQQAIAQLGDYIVVSEQLFGLSALRSMLKGAGFALVGLEKLLQYIDLLFTRRQRFMDGVKQSGYFYRPYVPFPVYFRNFLLELNAYDAELAQKQEVSMLFSCVVYMAFLDIYSEYRKYQLLSWNTINYRVECASGPLCCSGSLLQLFMQILNEQFSQQNAEFLIYAYWTLRKRALAAGFADYSFVTLEAAQTAAAGLFSSLQMAGISGFMKSVVEQVVVALEKACVVVGPASLIDVGRALQICLRFKESLCGGFVNYALQQAKPQAHVSLEDYARALLRFTPQLLINKQPVLDMIKAIYAAFLAECSANPANLSNFRFLLYNPDYFISRNAHQFSLQVYDYYSSFIPVLRLHKLFYATTDDLLTRKDVPRALARPIAATPQQPERYIGAYNNVGTKPLAKTAAGEARKASLEDSTDRLEALVGRACVIFASYGLGLGPDLEPFTFSADPAAQTNAKKAASESQVVFIEEQRPALLSFAHAMALAFAALKQSSTARSKMHFALQLLVSFATAITRSRCFEPDLALAEAAQTRFVQFVAEILGAGLDVIEQNSYADELKAALGVDFGDDLKENSAAAMGMAKVLLELRK